MSGGGSFRGAGKGASQSARRLPSGSEEAKVAPPSVDPARPGPPIPGSVCGEGRVPRAGGRCRSSSFQLQVTPVWGEAGAGGAAGLAGLADPGSLRREGAAGLPWRAACGGEALPRLPLPRHRSGQKEAPEAHRKSGAGGSLGAGRKGSGPPRHFFMHFPACLPVRPLDRPSFLP